ncbi:HNH endonuclease [Oceanobacillus sp. FSL H7-0719]|uniref:HNH endonuclease n=1 Tax=Oceanobacillus sp. FSL H7-0719 TaxID=2954507 RepID=UPI00324D5DC0
MTYSTPSSKKKFYGSKEWLWLRWQAMKRDNFECQQCKREGRVTIDSKKEEGKNKEIVLNVHHKKEIETHPELALEIDNLETLCITHHNIVHGKGFKPKKKKWNDEKW